jgi:uridine kinase
MHLQHLHSATDGCTVATHFCRTQSVLQLCNACSKQLQPVVRCFVLLIHQCFILLAYCLTVSAAYNFDHPDAFDNEALLKCLADLQVIKEHDHHHPQQQQQQRQRRQQRWRQWQQ